MKDKYGMMKTFSRGLSSGLEGSGKDLLNDVKIDQVHTGLGVQGIVNMTRQRHWHLTLEGICGLNEYRECVCVCVRVHARLHACMCVVKDSLPDQTLVSLLRTLFSAMP